MLADVKKRRSFHGLGALVAGRVVVGLDFEPDRKALFDEPKVMDLRIQKCKMVLIHVLT